MKVLLRAEEVAERLRISRPQVYAMAQRNEIPCVRFGRGAIRFPADEIDAWLVQRIVRPNGGGQAA